jgi:esterase/lipase superfamily enzyme
MVWTRVVKAAAVAALLALSACAGPTNGLLVPVANIPADTSKVQLFVATSRARAKVEPENMFDGGRATQVSHARVLVSVPPAHQTGQLELPSRVPGDPQVNFVTADRSFLTDKQFFDDVRRSVAQRPPANRDILVFIHGYNTRFEDSVYRMAQIVHDSGFKGVPILFTWPSKGQLLAYPYDRESAVFSRDDLERTLVEIARTSGARKFDVLAHSMGNFLFVETLRQAVIRGNGRFNGKLGEVMLAAPDIDIDVFRRQMQTIAPLRLPITIFVSQDDKALKVSRLVWQSEQRAGAYTIKDPAMAKRLEELNITVIDLSDVKSSDSLNHGKFAASPDVVRLIGNRLAQDGGIQGRGATLGESLVVVGSSLGNTVGGVAAGVVAAPVRALEGKSVVPLQDVFEDE